MHVIMWGIWKERNLRLLESKSHSYSEMIDSIVREVGGWVLLAKEFHGTPLSMVLCDWAYVIS